MQIPSRIEGSIYISGALSAKSMTLPDAVVTDDTVAADAAISALKLEHQFKPTYSKPSPASEVAVLHYVFGATGVVSNVVAGTVALCTGDATISIDVKKNGTTILTAPIVLDSANTAYVAEAGTVSVTALAAGDVLTVAVTATAGTGALGTGLFVSLNLFEDAQ